mgnify:CR=1 FL=1
MNDLDIINSISKQPIRPPEHVTLEQIINEVPNMMLDNPALYALYLYYNAGHLEVAEVQNVNVVMDKLKAERSLVNERNIDYMKRDDPIE